MPQVQTFFFIQYVNRLCIIFEHYLDSRVDNKDYDTLIDLILADRLKTSHVILRFVTRAQY